jgi:hypothetical protein
MNEQEEKISGRILALDFSGGSVNIVTKTIDMLEVNDFVTYDDKVFQYKGESLNGLGIIFFEVGVEI